MFWNTLVDALSSLWFSRQRTLLATIGIVIGSGSVIAMINVGQMVQKDAMKEFEKLGPDLIHLNINSQSVTYHDVTELGRVLDGKAFVIPVLVTNSSWTFSRSRGQINIIGTDESFEKVVGEELAEGRFLSRLDGGNLFAVIGSSAIQMKGSKDQLQPELMDQIQLKDVMLQIVGKLKPYGYNPMLGFEIDKSILVPIKTYQRFSNDSRIQTLLIKVEPEHDVATVGTQAKQYLENRVHGLEVKVKLAEQQIEAIKHQSRLITLLLGTMGSISLLVGGVGIMNVMLVSMTERRKEIGLRMAVGATPSSIIYLFLTESAVLTSLGGVLGLALGAGGAMLIGYFTHISYFFSSLAAVLGVGVSAIIGVFFGYYPALIASRLNPIDALNTE